MHLYCSVHQLVDICSLNQVLPHPQLRNVASLFLMSNYSDKCEPRFYYKYILLQKKS